MTIKRIPVPSPEYDQVVRLRDEVLRRPIGLSLLDEDLSGDVHDIILAAVEGDTIIACLMLQPKDGRTLKMRQMAVAPDRQGKGIGRELVLEAERLAWREGYGQIVLHAREVAQDFYLRLGYLPQGDVFTEVGIPHILMQKENA